MNRFLIYILILPLILNFIFFTPDYNSVTVKYNSNFTNSADPKCTDCHNDLVEKGIMHNPVDACDNCHGIKIKEHNDKPEKGLALTDKVPELCYTCHDDIKKNIETSLVKHGAVSEKKLCVNCHSPHSAKEKKLLISEEKQLCLSCHNKTITVGTTKIANMQQILKNKVVHPAIEGGCLPCHKPHASANNFLLKSPFPKGEYVTKKDSFALCFECHESGLLRDAKTTAATNFRNGDKNLHFLHVNQDKGRNCTLCHNMHASANEHLIESKVTFGNWEMPMKYTPSTTGGTCAPACHSEKKYTR